MPQASVLLRALLSQGTHCWAQPMPCSIPCPRCPNRPCHLTQRRHRSISVHHVPYARCRDEDACHRVSCSRTWVRMRAGPSCFRGGWCGHRVGCGGGPCSYCKCHEFHSLLPSGHQTPEREPPMPRGPSSFLPPSSPPCTTPMPFLPCQGHAPRLLADDPPQRAPACRRVLVRAWVARGEGAPHHSSSIQ